MLLIELMLFTFKINPNKPSKQYNSDFELIRDHYLWNYNANTDLKSENCIHA